MEISGMALILMLLCSFILGIVIGVTHLRAWLD